MKSTIKVDIVSVEEQIFVGSAEMIVITGIMGELGIMAGHTPLLTAIKPGFVRIILQEEQQNIYYVSGGILEVQPDCVTVLADTVIRADDLDEVAAEIAREKAKAILDDKKKSTLDITSALIQISQATAKLQTIRIAKSRKKEI